MVDGNEQQNFQMMADAFMGELQMGRVPVMIADHPHFQANSGVAVYYQHPTICVAPDWRERTGNLVRMMDEIKSAMEQAKKAQQNIGNQRVDNAENTQQERRPQRLTNYGSNSVVVRLYFRESHPMADADDLYEVELDKGGINIFLGGYSDTEGHRAVEVEYIPESKAIFINLNENEFIQNVRPEIPVFFQSSSYWKKETIPQYSYYEYDDLGQRITIPDGFEVVTEEEKVEVKGRVQKIKKFYIKPVGAEPKQGGGTSGYGGNRY